jgi:hypothetical protein
MSEHVGYLARHPGDRWPEIQVGDLLTVTEADGDVLDPHFGPCTLYKLERVALRGLPEVQALIDVARQLDAELRKLYTGSGLPFDLLEPARALAGVLEKFEVKE